MADTVSGAGGSAAGGGDGNPEVCALFAGMEARAAASAASTGGEAMWGVWRGVYAAGGAAKVLFADVREGSKPEEVPGVEG